MSGSMSLGEQATEGSVAIEGSVGSVATAASHEQKLEFRGEGSEAHE